jgi:hypothetical protein
LITTEPGTKQFMPKVDAIRVIMQNKPNFLNTQRNVTSIIKKVYRDIHLLGRRKNKPNSNPISLTIYFRKSLCQNP